MAVYFDTIRGEGMSDKNVRVIRLSEYVKGLKSNENGVELYNKYKNDIEKVPTI